MMSTDRETNSGRLRHVGDAAGNPVYYDDRRGTYHAWYDLGTYEPVSTTLLAAVSTAFDLEIDELETLEAYVEPDALNDLFDHWGGEGERIDSGSVSFPFAEWIVTVRTDGEIEIDPADRSATDQ